MRVVRQGKRKLGDQLVERLGPRGEPWVWIGAVRSEEACQEGTDLAAVRDGFIAVTPLHLNMTHEPSYAASEAARRDA